jgi:hypothetical protein
MVVRINTPASLQQTLNYNEHKVNRGVATCIAENHFPLPVNQLNFYQKLHWLEQRNTLNQRATTKTLHISLNFDPSEILSNDRLTELTYAYMERIGFGDQPYLVYRHLDAGHPHVHIVATTIQRNGARINTHNIGRNQSETARKEIETQFGLIRAESKKHLGESKMQQKELSKATYGKCETKRGITNILKQVLNTYNYTSLSELNAILHEKGVMADRGNPESFTYRNGGLLYRLLSWDKVPTGIPIKASTIAGKPTLATLEQKFKQNKKDRDLPRLSLQNTITTILHQSPSSLESFIEKLLDQNITTVLRQNKEGRLYGITFIDHRTRTVFNGSAIGKAFSIGGICQQLKQSPGQLSTQQSVSINITENLVLSELLKPEHISIPDPLLIKKKKRKKRI